MQVNPFDQYYIRQLVIHCRLKKFSLASEDKNDTGSKNFCCSSKNIKRIIIITGLKGISVYLEAVA